jgi:hypothetical protein
VLIDTVGQPAVVEESTSRLEAEDYDGNVILGTNYRRVCPTTPCSVDLPLGVHSLRFTGLRDDTWAGEGEVTIGNETTAYRYALGHNVTRRAYQLLGVFGIALGVPALVFGTGFAVFVPPNPAGVGVALGGGALIALGALLNVLFPYEHQNGTGAQWTL